MHRDCLLPSRSTGECIHMHGKPPLTMLSAQRQIPQEEVELNIGETDTEIQIHRVLLEFKSFVDHRWTERDDPQVPLTQEKTPSITIVCFVRDSLRLPPSSEMKQLEVYRTLICPSREKNEIGHGWLAHLIRLLSDIEYESSKWRWLHEQSVVSMSRRPRSLAQWFDNSGSHHRTDDNDTINNVDVTVRFIEWTVDLICFDAFLLPLSSEEHNRDGEQQQQQDSISFASGDIELFVTSTPIDRDDALVVATGTESDMENALFRDIEDLVREFLRRPNRQYPYYRIIRWTEGQNPRLEHVLTVVINRPDIIQQWPNTDINTSYLPVDFIPIHHSFVPLLSLPFNLLSSNSTQWIARQDPILRFLHFR